MTLREWCEQLNKERDERGKHEVKHERNHLRHVLPVIGDLSLTDASTPDAIRLFVVNEMPKSRNRCPGRRGRISPNTAHDIAATLSFYLRAAELRGVTPYRTVRWTRGDLPVSAASQNRMRVIEGYSVREIAALISDPPVPADLRVLYAVQFLAGAQTCEAAALRWRDWQNVLSASPAAIETQIEITPRRWRTDLGALVESGRGRVIPVHPRLHAILSDWYAEGWWALHGRRPGPSDLIVPSRTGKPLNNAVLWRLTRDVLADLGIAHRWPGDMSRTFGAMLVAAGVSESVVPALTRRHMVRQPTRPMWPALCDAVLRIDVTPPPAGVSRA